MNTIRTNKIEPAFQIRTNPLVEISISNANINGENYCDNANRCLFILYKSNHKFFNNNFIKNKDNKEINNE